MRCSKAISYVIALALSLGVQTAWADTCPATYSWVGEVNGDHFGGRVADAGDLNNDGFHDMAVGAGYYQDTTGRVYVYSGADGSLMLTITGEATGNHCSVVSTAGDVNKDGYDDLAVGAALNSDGAPCAGRVYLFYGGPGPFPMSLAAADADTSITGQVVGDNLGFSMAPAGDLDGDTYPDLLASAPRYPIFHGSGPGRAYVVSGRTFDTLYTLSGENPADLFGQCIGSAGDVNNDGVADIIVGAMADSSGGEQAGRAYVYSGVDGALLYRITGETDGDWLGTYVSGAGDVNQDGFDDVVVGAPNWDQGFFQDVGRAYVILGGSGPFPVSMNAADADYIFTGQSSNDRLGYGLCGVGDVNLDGYSDVAIGAYQYFASGIGKVYVYSVRDSTLLHLFVGESVGDVFGCNIDAAHDLNGDGITELLVGARYRYTKHYPGDPGPGKAYMFLLGDADGDSVETNCDNCPEVANTDQADADLDGFGDACDSCTDTDGDGYGNPGYPASICALDNCPDDFNPGQEDSDTDGTADACDNCVAIANPNQGITIAVTGDVNADDVITASDIIYLVNYVFKGGAAPLPCEAGGDVNCDGNVTASDIIYMVNHIFKGGPPPCDVCQAFGLGWTCP